MLTGQNVLPDRCSSVNHVDFCSQVLLYNLLFILMVDIPSESNLDFSVLQFVKKSVNNKYQDCFSSSHVRLSSSCDFLLGCLGCVFVWTVFLLVFVTGKPVRLFSRLRAPSNSTPLSTLTQACSEVHWVTSRSQYTYKLQQVVVGKLL